MKEEAKIEVEGLCRLLEEFGIEKGSRMLDFSCGIGRHSIDLARRGYKVVGYDPSALFINKAKSETSKFSELGKQIRFYNGSINDFKNILSSNNEIDFSAIIIMFTSIGYLTEDEDHRILRQLLELAKPGCILVIQTENRDWRIKNTPNNCVYEFDTSLINEIWEFDQYTSVAKSRSKYYHKNLDNNSLHLQLELQVRLRLYSLHELIRLLSRAGWTFVKSYGDIKRLDEVSLASPNLITVSKKG